ncbi:uroporphyrinogen-III C-methyltransferase [Segniliparus rugosus]|uniref:Uroporphyrinogen-III C-methyltransferase n=1 Tax=Segniliparus rugosus (strain ATCC BAA-974 / DSM 45345 / CCUG 50838 / CIP 108380 / JCM 13579 / CDC 945) TaxID=679197 RepID=E5XST2_SEGRC|nr:uroporphyrinogen-III C-methyltransferase [Segniliparus rugosus]EFV12609.1 uroporphyrinogen-III C-methyltransferase [Segniliparus rugosus ATCC BAA-974]
MSQNAAEPYLAGLNLADKPVVVVGGGAVARRRVAGLVRAGARVTVVAPEVTTAIEATKGVTVVAREYREGDLDGFWYALACTDDPEVNARVVAEADRLRVFCVRADQARSGSAVTPAIGRSGSLTVGVLAGGDHRRSAAARTAITAAIEDGSLDVEAEALPESETPGVALVGAGPGDPELITVRGKRLLARADVVVADRLAPPELLAELGPKAVVVDAAKVPGGRAMDQEDINRTLIEHARAGKFVVRLKGGDPYVFGRGFEEYLACVEAGVPVTVVPGVSSAIAAPALAQIPVTHRGVTHEVVIVSGHLAPEAPASLVDWQGLARLGGTLVLMMAVTNLPAISAALIAGGRGPATATAVIEDASRQGQRVLKARLDQVADLVAKERVGPPAVVVIGPVVALLDEAGASNG